MNFLGDYKLVETKAPYGYVANSTEYLVSLENSGQDVVTMFFSVSGLKNELKKGKVEGLKLDADDETALENATIGLFMADAEEFTSETAIITTVSDEKGQFSFDEIPHGSYFVKEIAAPTGYVLDENYYSVKIRTDGKVEVVSNDKSTDKFFNEIIRGDVHGLKVDADNRDALPGAVMALFKGDETAFNNNTALETVTTDKEGYFEFTEIKFGEYVVAEIKAPTGYVLSATKFPVNIDKDGSAKWADKDEIKKFMDENPRENIILTKTEGLTLKPYIGHPTNGRNKNVVVIGGSGTGKSRYFVTLNIMQLNSSFVITDPKGTILDNVGHMLQIAGYEIRILNLVDIKKSMHYNPLSYVKTELDVLKFG